MIKGPILTRQLLGLGDFIICNGLTRYLARDREVYVPVPTGYVESVSFMYRDNERIKVLPVDGDNGATAILKQWKDAGRDVIELGWSNLPFYNLRFDQEFYRQAGVPFEERWNSWHVVRDKSREIKPPTHPYVFLQDDPTRNLTIDRKHVYCGYPVIHCSDVRTNNIFDLCTIIEEAYQLDCINSSIMNLCEGLEPKAEARYKMMWHYYAKPQLVVQMMKRKWSVIQGKSMTSDEARAFSLSYGGLTGKHPKYTLEEWKRKVSSDEIRLGYWDWVLFQTMNENKQT